MAGEVGRARHEREAVEEALAVERRLRSEEGVKNAKWVSELQVPYKEGAI